jgi:two-component system sensor histidine kinase HydH
MELGIRAAATASHPDDPGRAADHSLAGRIGWITGLRLAFLVLMLGATAVLYLQGELERFPFSLRVLFVTIASGFALAAAYALALRRGRRLTALAWAQIALDQLTWTAIVYVSGGAASGAVSFYALTCLVGAVYVGVRGALGAAALGMALYALLCAGFALGWIHPPPDQVWESYPGHGSQITYPLLVNGLGVVVVALLSGYLAERLRLTGGALEAATARAQEAERLAVLGRIAAGLAHEIRNPLGSIKGSIEMLRESPALSDEDRLLCDIVQRETRRLNDLVGDMVDLSRPHEPRAEATDVAGLAREVVALASHAERGADVNVRYEGSDGEVIGRCDGAQMRQVVWNLVRNAIQASPAGATVTVRVAAESRNVGIAVDDEGRGVESGARIFDDAFTTRTHGAGIGLAVVRRIIESHAPMGAKLSVERAPGGGARFRVVLSRDVAGLSRSLRPPPAERLNRGSS